MRLFTNISDNSLDGKKPPDEIIVIAKLRELKVLIFNKFKITNIANVIEEYNKKFLKTCFKVSALLNEINLLKIF